MKRLKHLDSRKAACEGYLISAMSDDLNFATAGENKEYIVEREEYGECFDVYFDTDVPIFDEAFVLNVKNSIKIENLFKKLFSVWVSKNDGYHFESMSLLYKIFAEIQKENYIPQKQYDAIKPAIVYINENFLKKKISVSELSALCGISESYLKKLFLKKFAVPPIKYIIQLKINYACDLLRSNLYSITQAAEICGYSDPHFFCRQFKTYMGITPTEFVSKYKSSK
jgi:AraC-like DNA-binding protein